ncbi:hypothetical protein E3N88_39795 [Mikania micrantha]|uniref:Uncharacterized protein n=1 Tax=Mikania micrantha TaxID=192012 RepID=A0A5N6LN32_9ASTR|nr:hypothetical protein E3N88_39795 [Mikania micrantha]
MASYAPSHSTEPPSSIRQPPHSPSSHSIRASLIRQSNLQSLLSFGDPSFDRTHVHPHSDHAHSTITIWPFARHTHSPLPSGSASFPSTKRGGLHSSVDHHRQIPAVFISCHQPNLRKSKKGKSASSANETRRDLELFKDIRKLSSSDEPFVIFGDHLFKIINIARSRRMPNQKQSIPWNKRVEYYQLNSSE